MDFQTSGLFIRGVIVLRKITLKNTYFTHSLLDLQEVAFKEVFFHTNATYVHFVVWLL